MSAADSAPRPLSPRPGLPAAPQPAFPRAREQQRAQVPAPPLPPVREGMWIQVRGRCQVRGCPTCTWWPTALQLHPLRVPRTQPRSQWQLLAAAVLQAKGVGSRAPQPLSLTRVPHPEILFSCTPKWVSEDKRAGAAVPRHHSTERACCSHRGFSREPGLAPLGRKMDTWTLVEAWLPRREGAWARRALWS